MIVIFEPYFLATFEQRDGTKKTYLDYYNERYNIRVNDQNQPLLVSMPRDRDRRGGRTDAVLIPPEMCVMTGLTDEQRSNFNLMKSLAVYTRQAPAQRMEALRRFRESSLTRIKILILT